MRETVPREPTTTMISSAAGASNADDTHQHDSELELEIERARASRALQAERVAQAELATCRKLYAALLHRLQRTQGKIQVSATHSNAQSGGCRCSYN